MLWTIEQGYGFLTEAGSLLNVRGGDYVSDGYVFRGTDVWHIKGNRCRKITTQRFERALIKALKIGQKLEWKRIDDHMFHYKKDGSRIMVCHDHLLEMQRLGLFFGEFVVPRKLNEEQIKYAIRNYGAILYRLREYDGGDK